jgi:hypothetical protein
MHGGSFDVRYMHDQIAIHHHAISSYQREERSTTGDEAIRALTQAALPVLRQHLALAQAVDHAINGESGQSQTSSNSGNKSHKRAAKGSQQHG